MAIDRSEVSRALAKAIAFHDCGKPVEARRWARELVRLLECADILRPELPDYRDADYPAQLRAQHLATIRR